MVPENIHDFFLASGGVAGALIGLLFVAISVSAERLTRADAATQLHRVRAAAALTAFMNALVVSLFALIPGQTIGVAAVVVGGVGLTFVLASLLSLIRLRLLRGNSVRDAVFLVGLAVIFVIQLFDGAHVIGQPHSPGDVTTIATLVVVCFMVGIARAWELIGAPSIGIGQEIRAMIRGEHGTGSPADSPAADSEPAS